MIDIHRKFEYGELERVCRYTKGQAYHWDFTNYTGQVQALREFLIDNVPSEQVKEVAKMSDQQVHNIVIQNLLIPVYLQHDDEEVFLIPLEDLEKLPRLER